MSLLEDFEQLVSDYSELKKDYKECFEALEFFRDSHEKMFTIIRQESKRYQKEIDKQRKSIEKLKERIKILESEV